MDSAYIYSSEAVPQTMKNEIPRGVHLGNERNDVLGMTAKKNKIQASELQQKTKCKIQNYHNNYNKN